MIFGVSVFESISDCHESGAWGQARGYFVTKNSEYDPVHGDYTAIRATKSGDRIKDYYEFLIFYDIPEEAREKNIGRITCCIRRVKRLYKRTHKDDVLGSAAETILNWKK